MIKFLKITCFVLLISAVMTVGIFAADFDDLKNEAVSAGVDASLIGDENSLVKSANAEKFLLQYASADADLSGEYALTGEYLSAILNIMGYSEENGDFLAAFPYDKAAEVGILTSLTSDSTYLSNGMMLEYALAAKNSVSVLADFPVISEDGNILGLTNYYDPSVSENCVEMFSEGFGGLAVADSGKFNVSAVQGAGIYNADVKQVVSCELISDMDLRMGNYFAAYTFSGDELTVNVSINSDIVNGYEVYSTKSTYSTEFTNGILSITVAEPQTLKVVFDGAVGKTITVFIGKTGTDTSASAGNAVVGNITGNKTSGSAKYICPFKINVGNTIVYYPVIIKASKAYISEEAYVGDYSGNDALIFKGDVYLPISAFAGNGNIAGASYDSSVGLIKLSTVSVSDAAALNGFSAVSKDGTKLSVSDGTLSFENTDSTSAKGIMTAITPDALMTAECLKLTFDSSMTGKNTGVQLKFNFIGYNSLGETDIISEVSARAYSKEYATSVYLDISGLEGAYENYYLVISCDEAPGIVIILSGVQLDVFEISSDLGDNEFNPF